jgi:CBS domain-containing protein
MDLLLSVAVLCVMVGMAAFAAGSDYRGHRDRMHRQHLEPAPLSGGSGWPVADRLQTVMHGDPVTVQADTRVADASRLMRQYDIGDVIVVDVSGAVCGIVTDRDVVVRVVAEGLDPASTVVGDISSPDPVTLVPDDDIDRAIRVMRERALRRLPVTRGGYPVGVVSLGDLALDRDPTSVLADICAAPPNT